jgi:hypothetical protein
MDSKFHPYVDVHLGDIVGQAVWDSGASLTVVGTQFIERYPHLFLPDGKSTGIDATGNSVQTLMYRMAETVIGGCTFPTCRIAGVDLDAVNMRIEMPMDMILGYSLIQRVN